MSKDKTEEALKVYPYKVEIHSECTHSEREDKEFGQWSEEYTNTLGEVSRLSPGKDNWPDIVSTHSFKQGNLAYLVWVEYSSGDSFGNDTRGHTLALGLFRNGNTAFELKNVVEQVSNYRDKYSFEAATSDGQIFKEVRAPWCGYFENLDEVHVDQVIIH